MKNGLDNVDGSLQPPPAKRIKLEEDPNQEDRLLSRKKPGKGRKRKMTKSTIEDRALVLLNDDRISAVEPQQVLCRMCGHWVKLFKHTDFSAANWRIHAEKCEPRTGWKAHVRAEPGAKFTLTIPSLKPTRSKPTDASTSTSPCPTTAPATATSSVLLNDTNTATITVPKSPLKPLINSGSASASVSRRPMKSTAERLQILENDSRCDPLGPHEARCKICSQSVKLHNTREYDLWNWNRHVEKCEVKHGWVQPGSAMPQISNTLSENEFMNVDQAITPPSPDAPHQTERSAVDGFKPVAPVALASERISGEETTIHADGSNIVADRLEANELLEEAQRAEGLADQRTLIVEGSEDAHGPGPDDTMVQSASAPIVSFVKPEPEEHDGLLYPVPWPEPDTEIEEIIVPSTSISTGPRRRKGRTAEERRRVLIADTRTGEVRPHEVFCTMCSKWIKLYKDVEYVESNWMRHAERCSIRAAAKGNVSSIIAHRPDRRTSRHRKEPSSSGIREERRQNLQDDPHVSIIDPFELRCQLCNLQWNTVHEYDIAAFSKHLLTHHPLDSAAQRSQDRPRPIAPRPPVSESAAQAIRNVKAEVMEAGPSSAPTVTIHLTAPPRMTTNVAKGKDESTAGLRRRELELDGRCENIEPQRVTCKLCNRTVGLHVKKDYSLSNWYRHITSCGKGNKKVEKSIRPPVKTPLSAIGFTRSTAAPAVASSSVPVTPLNAVDPPTQDTTENLISTPDAEVQMIVSAPAHVDKASKSTAEERRAKLLLDPRVAAVKPNRIQCKLCEHWLKLNEFMEYAPYNWYKHIERCELRMRLKNQGTSDTPVTVKAEEPPVVQEVPVLEEVPVMEEVPVLDDTSVSVNLSTRKRSTAAERLARMQADSRIKTIEKHRCRCGLCDKWVKLQNKTEYDAHNWFAHIKKCVLRSIAPEQSETVTSKTPDTLEGSNTINGDFESATLTAETAASALAISRRELLMNDTRTAAVESQRVLCAICNMWIKLRDGKQYVPYNWFKHRRKCERRHGLPQTLLQMPSKDDSEPTPTFTKDIVKKESISIDFSLYNNDARKMTDEQRAAQLRADPRLGDVEPGRVFCKMCDSWIKLNMSNGFLRGNWLRHADRCKGRMSWAGMMPETGTEPPELSAVEVIDLEAENSVGGHFGFVELGSLIGKFEPTISSTDYGNAADAKPTPQPVKQLVARSVPVLRARPNTPTIVNQAPQHQVETKATDTSTGKRPHRSEQMRKHELENDPRTKIVQPDKILCALCDRWIQMRRDVAYSPQNWLKHAGICEQRTGWIKNHKTENDEKPAEPVVRGQSEFEELVPYNARHVNEQPDIPAPSLTPVNWDKIIYSDEDEDDETAHSEAMSSSVVPPLTKPAPTSVPTQTTTFGRLTLQKPAYNGISAAGNTSKPQTSTSLGVPQAHMENQTVPISASTTGIRKPTTSPPLVTPFSTVQLPFYRATYASPVGHQSYAAASNDGVPAKSLSPQNGGSQQSYQQQQQQQRPMPFVVPASSMLPHLLPRPVLVPISHTATAGHQRSAIRSPFQLPATPPLSSGLSVPIAKSNGASLPTPPHTNATTTNGVGAGAHSATGSPTPSAVGGTPSPAPAGSGRTVLPTTTTNGAPTVPRPNSSAATRPAQAQASPLPVKSAEVTGVAVPTPIRSIPAQAQASPLPVKSAEVTGVAVPTPIRSIFGQSVMTAAGPSSSGGKSSTSPPVPVPVGVTATASNDPIHAK